MPGNGGQNTFIETLIYRNFDISIYRNFDISVYRNFRYDIQHCYLGHGIVHRVACTSIFFRQRVILLYTDVLRFVILLLSATFGGGAEEPTTIVKVCIQFAGFEQSWHFEEIYCILGGEGM